MLKIYNSLTKRKEVFKPINSDHIKMYVCGPTVYDDIHIGNARPIVVFDSIFKTLNHIYKKVTYVRNITDIDDKILQRAKQNKEPINSLTEKTIQSFHSSIKHLNVERPTFEPKATEHIEEIIQFISKLLDKGYAYNKNNSIFFNVSKYKHYGQLSGLLQENLLHNVRIQNDHSKNNSSDFVLWKPSTAITEEPSEGWDSPWGVGRPGWHIECSAMANKYLGNTFDIHGGGKDLIFPHHENEIAQSHACNDANLANYWLHNGWMTIDGEKMSKSLGNFITLNDVLNKYSGETIRLTLLSSHYRQPLAFKEQTLEQSKNILSKLYSIFDNYKDLQTTKYADIEKKDKDLFINSDFMHALLDDFNTPLAIQILQHKLFAINTNSTKDYYTEIIQMAFLLGILQNDNHASKTITAISKEEIEDLINQRNECKKQKDFATADKIRNNLLTMGIILEDSPCKTIWKIK